MWCSNSNYRGIPLIALTAKAAGQPFLSHSELSFVKKKQSKICLASHRGTDNTNDKWNQLYINLHYIKSTQQHNEWQNRLNLLCVLSVEHGRETCKLSVPNKLFNITQGFPQGYGVASQRIESVWGRNWHKQISAFTMKLKWRLVVKKMTPTGEQYCHVCLLNFFNSSKQET